MVLWKILNMIFNKYAESTDDQKNSKHLLEDAKSFIYMAIICKHPDAAKMLNELLEKEKIQEFHMGIQTALEAESDEICCNKILITFFYY